MTRAPSVPKGYELVGDPASGWCAYRAADAAALQRSGFGLSGDGAVRTADLRGRGALLELRVPEFERDGRSAVLRHHRRGGLPQRLGLREFKDPGRPFDELLLSESLRERGIRTPRVLAARALPKRAAASRAARGYELALVTERIAGGRDLAIELADADAPRRHQLFAAAGAFARSLFEVGLVHVDLHPKNMVVQSTPVESRAGAALWIVDLDRCSLRAEVRDATRLAMLGRFLRWCRKHLSDPRLSRADALRFLAAAVEPQHLATAWRRLAPRL